MHNPMAQANAGVLAARIASSAGKKQRGRMLSDAELAELATTAEAFITMREVALNETPYWRWAQDESTAATLVEFAVTHKLLGGNEAAGLAKIAYLLHSASAEMNEADLAELRDFFVRVANAVAVANSRPGCNGSGGLLRSIA